jgi:tetratricopeptide (TPR) repeat protein
LAGDQQQGADATPVIAGLEGLKEAARGGQGIVYSATQSSTGRRVAVKVLLAGSQATQRQRQRFEREVEVVLSLEHPGIVTIHDRGITAAGQLYLVMGWVDGDGLSHWKQRTSPSVEERLDCFMQICEAVRFAHQKGVIHRDLKPSNIMVERGGQTRVLDFGLARVLESGERDEASMLTRSGDFVGTLSYASPEQFRAESGALDVRSDVYSLGAILFELLTGSTPISGDVPLGIFVQQMLDQERPPASALVPGLDRDLDLIVSCALRRDPDRRYQSVAELLADLSHYRAHEPIAARGESTWYLLQKTVSRHRIATFSLLVLILGLAAATFISQRALRDAQEELARAEAVIDYVINLFDQTTLGKNPGVTTVSELLRRAAIELGPQFSDHPRIEAAVGEVLARAIQSAGMSKEALPLYDRTLELMTGWRDEQDPVVMELRILRASALMNSGDIEQAQAELSKLQSEHDAAEEHPTLNEALAVTRADALFDQGRFEAALVELRRVEAADTARMDAVPDGYRGPKSELQLAEVSYRISEVLGQLGRYEESEAMAQRTLELTVDLEPALVAAGVGAERSIRARFAAEQQLVMLAILQEKDGVVEIAERVRREVGVTLGEETGDYLRATAALAAAYRINERFDESIALAEESMELSTRLQGPKNRGTVGQRYNLGTTLVAAGRFHEAAELLGQVLKDFRELGGGPGTIRPTLFDLASAQYELGEYEQALSNMDESLDMAEELFGGNHFLTAATRINRAAILNALGRPAEAAQELQSILALPAISEPGQIQKKLLVDAALELCKALSALGHEAEALALLDMASQTASDQFGPAHRWLEEIARLRERVTP